MKVGLKRAAPLLVIAIAASGADAQSVPPTQGQAANGNLAWHLQGSYPDPTGNTAVAPGGVVTVLLEN